MGRGASFQDHCTLDWIEHELDCSCQQRGVAVPLPSTEDGQDHRDAPPQASRQRFVGYTVRFSECSGDAALLPSYRVGDPGDSSDASLFSSFVSLRH